MNPVIVGTVGDPASIGPEVALSALWEFYSENSESSSTTSSEKRSPTHLFAPRSSLERVASQRLKELESSGSLTLHDMNSGQSFKPGVGSIDSGRRAYEDLRAAIAFCMSSSAAALVTGPVDKFLVAKTDPNFRGQTGYLMDQTGSPSVCMMLASSDLRVSLVTTHLALKDVPAAVTSEKIIQATRLSFEYLQKKIQKPKIAIAALNPHASDRGLMGDEEDTIIKPAVLQLKKIYGDENIVGPEPADTLFHFRNRYDLIVCMYHDQGLIPLKMLGFEEAINISLGLPFLRTSVDHGTAFDIVGTNKASSLSYLNALREAHRSFAFDKL